MSWYSRVVQDVFTRPANTDIYAATDVIAATTSNTDTTPLRSLKVANNTRPVRLRYLRIDTNKDDFLPTIRVHFYNVASPDTAVVGDNVAHVLSYANVEDYIGYATTTPALADVGDYASVQLGDTNALDLLMVPDATGNVYYRLAITTTTPTPASEQSFTITVGVVDA